MESGCNKLQHFCNRPENPLPPYANPPRCARPGFHGTGKTIFGEGISMAVQTRVRKRAGCVSPGIACLGIAMLATSCTTTPAHYQELASTAQLHANTSNTDKRVAFNTSLDPKALRAYSAVTLEPVRVYRGSDHQFGNLSENAKADLAKHADRKFAEELRRQGLVTGTAGAPSLRMRVTITGAQTSVPVLSTATKVMPVGFALNGLKMAGDKEARFSGAVIYAVELFDARDGGLIYAFVTRQYPNALNIPASVLPLDAAKAGIDRGASTTATSLKGLLAPRTARSGP
jgi:hypothetical protein